MRQQDAAGPGAQPEDEDEPVPIFGSWRGIYAAVILSALGVMVLIALFSTWDF